LLPFAGGPGDAPPTWRVRDSWSEWSLMPDPPRPTYTPEEAAEILKRALKQQSMKDQGLTHDELVEMAAEVGIDRGALEAATADVTEARASELARQSEARDLSEERARLLGRFMSSLLVYVVVNLILFSSTRVLQAGGGFTGCCLAGASGSLFSFAPCFSPGQASRVASVTSSGAP